MSRHQILENALDAIIPKKEYDVFNEINQKNAKKLQESALKFKTQDIQEVFICESAKNLVNFKILPQASYTNIPFRMEEYDTKSTIASSGCAILIAKCLEHLFECDNNFSIEELAKTAVEKGYRGYKKNADGSWIAMGCRHVFFDRFIPSVYGLKVQRVDSINSILDSLKEGKVSVLLVSNKVYKDNQASDDSHFLILLGYNKSKLIVWDSEIAKTIAVEYGRIIHGLKIAWIVEK